MSVLGVTGLAAGYGAIPVLDGLSFAVAEGELVGILGHNGMGKTTVLRALMGFLPATAGAVRFDGHDITRAPPQRRNRLGLGLVPQGREIFGNYVLDCAGGSPYILCITLRKGICHDNERAGEIRA